jgi:hypothetical protein
MAVTRGAIIGDGWTSLYAASGKDLYSDDDDDDDGEDEKKKKGTKRKNRSGDDDVKMGKSYNPWFTTLNLKPAISQSTTEWYAKYQDPEVLIKKFSLDAFTAVSAAELHALSGCTKRIGVLCIAMQAHMNMILDGSIDVRFSSSPQISRRYTERFSGIWTKWARRVITCIKEHGFALTYFELDSLLVGVPMVLDLTQFDVRVFRSAVGPPYYIARPREGDLSTRHGIGDDPGTSAKHVLGSPSYTPDGWLRGLIAFTGDDTAPNSDGTLRSICKMALHGIKEQQEHIQLVRAAQAKAVFPTHYTVDAEKSSDEVGLPSLALIDEKLEAQTQKLHAVSGAITAARSRGVDITGAGRPTSASVLGAELLTPAVETAAMFSSSTTAPLMNILSGRQMVFTPSAYVPELEPEVDERIREDIAKLFQVPISMLKVAGSSMPLVQESREKIHHDTSRMLKAEVANSIVAPMLHAIYDKHRLSGARTKLRKKLGLSPLDFLEAPTEQWIFQAINIHVKMPNVPSFAMMESLWEKGVLKQEAYCRYLVEDYGLREDDLNEDETDPPITEAIIVEPEGPSVTKKPKKATTAHKAGQGSKDHGEAARKKKAASKDTRREKGRGTTKKVTRGQ